jgi:oxygen-dependent protoporphyrinogen oxidase
MTERVDAVVVGAGITGLAAARALALEGAHVTILDPEPVGGKLRTTPFDGGALDEAADAFLARVPEGVALCRDLGIDGDLVSPAERHAYVYTGGALRRLPQGQVLGVPTDLEELAGSGIVSRAGLERARRDLVTPLVAPDGDPTIGAVVRDRLGDEVAERLVDPLVGGINAGLTDELSLAATVPQLDAAVRSGAPSLIEACQAQRAANPDPDAPVFFAPSGGLGALVDALVADLAERGAEVRDLAAASVEPGEGGRWRVVDSQGGVLAADAVVLATPAGAAAQLVGAAAPQAGARLAGIRYASVALVALAVARDAIDRELDGSGYLVPRVEGHLVLTACSWVSAKWPHLHGDGTVWLRASVGRDGDTRALDVDDDTLRAAVQSDLALTMALRGPVQEVRLTRWYGSFPQYRPGHLERVDAIDADLAARAPGLAVAGAALRGLGIPACIRQGTAAAGRALHRSA